MTPAICKGTSALRAARNFEPGFMEGTGTNSTRLGGAKARWREPCALSRTGPVRQTLFSAVSRQGLQAAAARALIPTNWGPGRTENSPFGQWKTAARARGRAIWAKKKG